MKNLGKNWGFIFADYGWGWSHFNEHKAVLEKLGGNIGKPIAVPLGAKDFLPYLAKVDKNTDELYSIFFGSQAVAYYTQSKSLGLDKRMKRYSVICTHESISPKDMGGASEGIYMLEYHPRMLKYKDTPHNRKVRDLMRVDPVDGKEDGSKRIIAGSHYWAVWESVFFIQKALEKSGWKSKKDTPDFIQALEGLAVKESFEHPQGFFEVFNGAGNYDIARIVPGFADPFDIVEPGLAIKRYPCCGSTHPAIDALLELRRRHRLGRHRPRLVGV